MVPFKMLKPCEKAQNDSKKGRTKQKFAIMVFVYGCLALELYMQSRLLPTGWRPLTIPMRQIGHKFCITGSLRIDVHVHVARSGLADCRSVRFCRPHFVCSESENALIVLDVSTEFQLL